MIKRLMASVLASMLASMALVGPARADTYPDKPVKLVVAFAPGGSTDAMARMLATGLSSELKQTVFVENRPGAGGNIGAAAVARAEPDGYTLLMLSSGHVANVALYRNPGYDIQKDFAPVSRLAINPNVLVVNEASPARTFAELIAEVKAARQPMTYGSAGSGTGQHLAGALFSNKLNVPLTHVPYKGGGLAAADLLAGRVDMIFAPYVEVKAFIDSKKMRALAVTTPTRSPLLPAVPAIAETMPGFELVQWNSIVAPKAMPADRIAILDKAIVKVVNSPEIQKALLAQGIQTATTTPAELQKIIDADLPKWAEVVKISGASAD